MSLFSFRPVLFILGKFKIYVTIWETIICYHQISLLLSFRAVSKRFYNGNFPGPKVNSKYT